MVTALEQLAQWAATAPPGTLVSAASLAESLAKAADGATAGGSAAPDPEPQTWRERLWTAHADVRVGVRELSEAIDRPESWVYRHTSPKSGLPLLPHRKFDGQLVFVVGEIRAWIQRNETIVVAGRAALQLAKPSHSKRSA